MSNKISSDNGIISYFTKNSVAANLLMLFISIVGLLSYFLIQKQLFPTSTPNYIEISAYYPGASPLEIEENILIKIEEKLKNEAQIDKIISYANRNKGRVRIKLSTGADINDSLDIIKLYVDSIATFPQDMEPLKISKLETPQNVMEISLVGEYPLPQLKLLSKEVRNELLLLEHVSIVELLAPEEEISIDVPIAKLKAYQLTLEDIALTITAHSANLSAGQISTEQGAISIRVNNQSISLDDFRNIPVKTSPGGGIVLLHEVASVVKKFVGDDRYLKFSGENAISLIINATQHQNIMHVADSVNLFIKLKNKSLPTGLSLKVLVDYTYYLDARLNMMFKNLFQGACLVAILLSIFLRFRVAFWVMAGLPICFLGAVIVMPLFGLSINIVTLFAFIMVLGIVVDDAIVTAESVYSQVKQNGSSADNVIKGVKKVATPATFGVITTMAVFAPFVFSSGPDSTLFYSIAMVAILCLIFSLIESKLILPAHLAHIQYDQLPEKHIRTRFNNSFDDFVYGPYKELVTRCTEDRWLTMVVFFGILLISVALITSDRVRFVPEPSVPHDFPSINIRMNDNSSVEQTIFAIKKIEQIILDIDKQTGREYGATMVRDILSLNDNRTEGRLIIPLVDEAIRPYDTFELARRWRQAIPNIPSLKSISINDNLNGDSKEGDFGYRLYAADMETLREASTKFLSQLKNQSGIVNVNSTLDSASKEIQLTLLPVAYDFGLTLQNIAKQVGAAFYGKEAQKVLLAGEEIRVMVHYPEKTQEQEFSLLYTQITTPNGAKVMLGDVAEFKSVPGTSFIRREQGLRNVYISGDIDKSMVTPNQVIKTIREVILPSIKNEFPTLRTELGGAIEEQNSQLNEQIVLFIAGVLSVYILLAVPLKSYTQPLIILLVIPLSFTGAIWGHYIFGIDISTLSIFGLIAAAGVVINDSLVMTDFINKARSRGLPLTESVIESGCARFRAILLTSLTTFVGVLPLMFESSLQAKLVVPMAVGLGFAVLFATVISLLLLPSLYLILEDINQWLSRKKINFSERFNVPNIKSVN
jgi:multidrug efflux pump subunit AcrB